MVDIKDPNGTLTRHEFLLWQVEHQKFLDARFDKICNGQNEIKALRLTAWNEHRQLHKADEEKIVQTFVACRAGCATKISKNFKWLWISIGAMFLVLILSNPHIVAMVLAKLVGVDIDLP